VSLSTSVAAYSVDTARLPLVVVSPTPHVLDDSALEVTYAQLERVLGLETPLYLLFDLRGGTSSPKRRQRLTNWQAARKEQLERNVRAMAIVVGSTLERGFVTAALWLFTPAYPMRVFTEPREAEAWLFASGVRPAAR
jgi:hypothetical protein